MKRHIQSQMKFGNENKGRTLRDLSVILLSDHTRLVAPGRTSACCLIRADAIRATVYRAQEVWAVGVHSTFMTVCRSLDEEDVPEILRQLSYVLSAEKV